MAGDTNDHSKKIAEASKAVAHFGFLEENVKDTLKRLVKLYNNDWKLIEEENYRLVIDILMKESKVESNLNSNLKHCQGQNLSSAVNVPNKRAKMLHFRPQEKGKDPEFPQSSAGGTRLDFEKDEETKDRAHESVSISSQFDIASSVNAEVKVDLICNSSGNSFFRQRSLDAVLGEVEDECRETYGIQNPDFSLVNLMEKVCQYFLEIDKGSGSVPGSKVHAITEQAGERNLVSKDDNKSNYELEPSKVLQDPRSSDSQIMEAVLQKKYPIYLKDISRGEENIPIPLVNESSTLELPDFIYIKNNMVYQQGHVDFSLARISDDNCCAQCFGDCLSSDLPCACAAETGGEFVYTQDGLLREEFLKESIAIALDPKRKHYYYCEICPLQNDPKRFGRIKPCKGHLTRKFIKECWSKCGCSKKCGNRVVQRGIHVDLQVFAAPEGKGWGVRSVNALKKGTFVCEYVGEIVTNDELYERNNERAAKKERHTYPVLLDADWGSERILEDKEALCLDATEFGNVGRFVNHRCYDSNLIEIPVEVETPDHHYYRLAFFTTRDIEPMEELTWDYGIKFDDKYHPVKAFKCKCGSMRCRGKKMQHLITD